MRIIKYVLFLLTLVVLFVVTFLTVKLIFNRKEAITGQAQAKIPVTAEKFITWKIISAPNALVNGTINRKNTADNLHLLGVMAGKETYAFIDDLKNNQQKIYRAGENVADFKILEILSDRIIIQDAQGVDLTLEIYQGSESSANTAIIKIDEETRQISRNAMGKELNTLDVGRMINTLEINPQFKNSTQEIIGFQVAKIPEKSLLERAGLKNDDIIVAVNDEKINDLQQGFEIYNRLQTINNGSEIAVTILRNGQQTELKYRIEP